MGRRKIKMEKVQDTNTKQVTFSKRRLGLFKKASELATLCNAEKGSKMNLKNQTAVRLKHQHSRGKKARQEKKICKRLNSTIREAETEKKRGEDLQKCLESAGEEMLIKPIEELTLEELNELEAKMKKTHGEIQGTITKCKLRLLSCFSPWISSSHENEEINI